MDVKIAKGAYIPKEKVLFYCAYDNGCAKRMLRDARQQGKRIIDLTGGRQTTLSVVVTSDWTFFRVGTAVATLNERMDPHKDSGVQAGPAVD